MTFEAQATLSPGRSILARLIPAENRVEVEPCGHVAPPEVEAVMPDLLALLADKSRLPVRHAGRCYYPRPLPARPEWGER